MINISEVLSLYKSCQVNDFLQKYTGKSLEEKNLKLRDIEKQWRFLGDNNSNSSTISILKKGEKGIVERLTNAIDAVIEKQRDIHNMGCPSSSSKIIEKAFPKYFCNLKKIYSNNDEVKSQVYDVENQVILAVNDGSKTNKPTFDILDKGIGVNGKDFSSTLLSINKGNKLASDKKYLIGAFGQGGSTSLPFTESTIIISKSEGKYFFTIIKSVELSDYKTNSYVYMCIDNSIPELSVDDIHYDSYLHELLESESGTLVRMVETDISREYRNNDISKPRMLVDYINTELFNVGIPVKIVENRSNYRDNKNAQNRYAYGTLLKLNTSKKYIKNDYSGNFFITHNENQYKIDYYMILPDNTNEWGSDVKCKSVFEQFNVYGDPILYTVNGQTITTETYTKLKNKGLTFLRYRLLIVINLDDLGNEKYKFFTSDRAQIRETDITKGFLDEVVKRVAEIDQLREINEIIAEKCISSSIDESLLNEISSEVQDIYNKFLISGDVVSGRKRGKTHTDLSDDEFLDHIEKIEITSLQREFFKDESVKFVLTTKAAKYVNQQAMICPYIDGINFHAYSPNFMNGRVSYIFNNKEIGAGVHNIEFIYFDDNDSIKSELVDFEIINEKSPISSDKTNDRKLDLNIIIREEAELICDISKDSDRKKIEALICLDSDELTQQVYGYNASADEISETKNKIIKPMVLFALFMGDLYDKIKDEREKNKIIIAFIKSTLKI